MSFYCNLSQTSKTTVALRRQRIPLSSFLRIRDRDHLALLALKVYHNSRKPQRVIMSRGTISRAFRICRVSDGEVFIPNLPFGHPRVRFVQTVRRQSRRNHTDFKRILVRDTQRGLKTFPVILYPQRKDLLHPTRQAIKRSTAENSTVIALFRFISVPLFSSVTGGLI